MIFEDLETYEDDPYIRIRIGVIEAVYYDSIPPTPSEANLPLSKTLGYVKIKWADTFGERDFIQLSFPSLSNDIQTNSSKVTQAFAYGDLSLPAIGSLAIIGFRNPMKAVILGYLPYDYNAQTASQSLNVNLGRFRRIIPGEFTRLSRQQAEVYQDKTGAIQLRVKAQPSKSNPSITDGSAVTSLSDLDVATLPSTDIASVTIGETYTDETFATRVQSSQNKPVILQINCVNGANIKIDSAGNFDINTAPSMNLTINGGGNMNVTATAINFNNGTQGVARKNDATLSNASLDSSFWTFITALSTHTHAGVTSGGGTSGTSPALASPPSQQVGEINAGSTTVKSG